MEIDEEVVNWKICASKRETQGNTAWLPTPLWEGRKTTATVFLLCQKGE